VTTDAAAPRAILVVRLGAVGDVVRTLPAVTCLKRTWPGARIVWAVEEPSAPLLQGHPALDDVKIFRIRALKKMVKSANLFGLASQLREYAASLRSEGFDWAIDFQGTIKSAMIARLGRARKTIGMGAGHAREQSYRLYSHPVAIPRDPSGRKMSRGARALALVASLGADVSSPERSLPRREDAAAIARAFLDAKAPKRPRVLIYPGTSQAQAWKRYPPEMFARVGDALGSSFEGSVLLGWGPGEEWMVEEVRRRMSRAPVILPRTSLPELTEILRECDLFIGSDTGPLHIAAAAGTRTIALYGPTDPAVNAADTLAPGLSLVGDVICRPCRRRGCQNRSCLRLIDPALVSERAHELLRMDASADPGRRAPALELVKAGR